MARAGGGGGGRPRRPTSASRTAPCSVFLEAREAAAQFVCASACVCVCARAASCKCSARWSKPDQTDFRSASLRARSRETLDYTRSRQHLAAPRRLMRARESPARGLASRRRLCSERIRARLLAVFFLYVLPACLPACQPAEVHYQDEVSWTIRRRSITEVGNRPAGRPAEQRA